MVAIATIFLLIIKERIERADEIIKLDYDEEMNKILKIYRII